ncbi:MAG: hypothetical protein ACUVRL_07285 [Candidatus Saccharicenans sp.]|uniref:hypothetical protein n=1 Tax=Candidatus Saccharicenans sp. TaxID=2819258 RepID=UPI00404A941B
MFNWLKDSQASTLGLGIQSSQRLAQRQSLIPVKAKSLSHNTGPESQYWSSINHDNFRAHFFSFPGKADEIFPFYDNPIPAAPSCQPQE